MLHLEYNNDSRPLYFASHVLYKELTIKMRPHSYLLFAYLFIYYSNIYWILAKCQEPGCVWGYKDKSHIHMVSAL